MKIEIDYSDYITITKLIDKEINVLSDTISNNKNSFLEDILSRTQRELQELSNTLHKAQQEEF